MRHINYYFLFDRFYEKTDNVIVPFIRFFDRITSPFISAFGCIIKSIASNEAEKIGGCMCDEGELKKIEAIAKHTDESTSEIKKAVNALSNDVAIANKVMATKEELQKEQKETRSFMMTKVSWILGTCALIMAGAGIVGGISVGNQFSIAQARAAQDKSELLNAISQNKQELAQRFDKLESKMDSNFEKLIHNSQK